MAKLSVETKLERQNNVIRKLEKKLKEEKAKKEALEVTLRELEEKELFAFMQKSNLSIKQAKGILNRVLEEERNKDIERGKDE